MGNDKMSSIPGTPEWIQSNGKGTSTSSSDSKTSNPNPEDKKEVQNDSKYSN